MNFVSSILSFRYAAWIIPEVMIRFISVLLVMVALARYLGPTDFGKLSISLAVLTILMPICKIGADNLIINELSIDKPENELYLATLFWVVTVSSLITYILLTVVLILLPLTAELVVCILIICLPLIFQNFSVLESSLQAQLKQKFVSIAKLIGVTVGAALKILLIYHASGLHSFAFAHVAELMITYYLILYFYACNYNIRTLFQFRKKIYLSEIKRALPIIVSTLLTVVLMRLDQFMIAYLLGTHEVGIYTAGAKFYEAWLTASGLFIIAALPKIFGSSNVEEFTENKNLIFISALFFWAGVLLAVTFSVFAPTIISVSFGEAFLDARVVASIMMWAAPFSVLGTLGSRYFINQKREFNLVSRSLIGLGINVLLNGLMIPAFGIQGAAVSTLVTIFCINYVYFFIFEKDMAFKRVCFFVLNIKTLTIGLK